MSSVTSRVPGVLAYLVAAFQAAPSLGGATPRIAVYDGPAVTADAPGLVLWVGLDDPDSITAPLAATSDRQWSGLAGQSETITVYCAAESWTGVDDIATERVAVYAIVNAVETLVRTDTTQFGGNSMLADPGVTGSALRQNDTNRGGQARVTFQIILTAL